MSVRRQANNPLERTLAKRAARCFAGLPLWVANAEMLSVTATRRLVRSRAGSSRGDCRKSGMWRIAASDKMNTGHAEFGGPGHLRSQRMSAESGRLR
jgi:hypothetical protein